VPGPDPDVKAFFDSLTVSTQGNRAIVNASVPPGFLKKVLAGSEAEIGPTAGTPPSGPAGRPVVSVQFARTSN